VQETTLTCKMRRKFSVLLLRQKKKCWRWSSL